MLEEGVLLVGCSGTGRCPVCGGLGKRKAIGQWMPGTGMSCQQGESGSCRGGGAEGEDVRTDGSLTPKGYRDAGIWRQGVRWA